MRPFLARRPAVGSDSRRGLQRVVNEDALGLPEGVDPALRKQRGHLYVVADGMGGHAAGEQASALAVHTVLETFYRHPDPDLRWRLMAAVHEANAVIHRQAQNAETAGMGTTVVAALLHGRDLYVAHVGDSRAYRVRGETIERLTADHTLVAETVRLGAITAEEAQTHPYRHVLTRSLGSEPQVEVDLSHHLLRRGDRIVLTTDGLTAVVSDEEIRDVVRNHPPGTAARVLGELAAQRGNADDATVVVIDPFPARLPRWLQASSLRALLGGILLALLILGGVLWQARGGGRGRGIWGNSEELTRAQSGVWGLNGTREASQELRRAQGNSPPASSLELQSTPTSSPELQRTPTSPAGTQYAIRNTPGDVNGDGIVNIFDLIRIGRVYGQSAAADPAADLNGDGQIDLFDVVMVASAYGGGR